MTETINKVSSEAVEKATGRSWDKWIAFIDKNGGAELDHKAIVKLLGAKGKIESGWWQQMVTVGYEHAKGRRETGETADAGYQVGVQMALPLGRDALWELVTSPAGVRTWLGSARGLVFEPGVSFKTSDGGNGEIRTAKPGQRLRLSWKPKGRKTATTLQMTLSCPRNTRSRTTLRFHHEKLASVAERERMRKHWKMVLEELATISGP